jgi:enoyl-CoA hydratase
MQAGATDEVLIRREGRAGRITLNRPKALNALTYAMIEPIWKALQAWVNDDGIALILLDGAGERGLCAGGDVRSLYESRTQGPAHASRFWMDEYRLNALIGRYPKPYVAIQDGIVMGGGIGLSAHGSHRVVTERSRLAMPETGIGLIPDVGGTWLLAHAPGETGLYLGLTGHNMRAADAIHAKFSDVLIPAASIATLCARLCDPAGGEVSGIVRDLAQPAGVSALEARQGDIDRAFAGRTLEDILQALSGMPGDWAATACASLLKKSPKSLKLTLAAIRQARHMHSLEEALAMEYRLVTRVFEDGEFPEGVRALIIDKDNATKWSPPRIGDVTPELVARYLSPLPPSEELTFGA